LRRQGKPEEGQAENIYVPSVAIGNERLWKIDISTLVRRDDSMDRVARERLGHYIVSRRVAMGYRNRSDG
jgi:hypothetical protein